MSSLQDASMGEAGVRLPHPDDDGDDLVETELPVYVCNEFLGSATQLALLQCPLRAPWRPYEYKNKFRMKPNARRVEVEIPLDTRSRNYNEIIEDFKKIDTVTLRSQIIEPHTSVAIGTVQDGKLLLVPVDFRLQMRPSLPHLNTGNVKKKNDDEEEEEEEDEPVMHAVEVQVQKRETERQQQARLNSFAHLSAKEEEEPWVQMNLLGAETRAADQIWTRFMTPKEAALNVDMSRGAYLKAFVPSVGGQQNDGAGASVSGAGTATGGGVAADASAEGHRVSYTKLGATAMKALIASLTGLFTKHSVCNLDNVRTWLASEEGGAGGAKECGRSTWSDEAHAIAVKGALHARMAPLEVDCGRVRAAPAMLLDSGGPVDDAHYLAVADAAGALVVTPAEVRAAATHSKPGTTPGPDGIPVDVWRKLGEPVFELLAAVFTAVGATGGTPPGFLDGVVASIYNAKNAADAANYRPLTMLGSDYRILAKVLATRWTPLLSAVVGAEQTAFLAGRRISDNICLTQMLPGLLAANAAEGVGPTGAALALLDFRKAYDTIDRGFLIAVMEAVGVGDGVLAWTRTILTHTYASAEVNGFISAPRKYAAGVRQGCPAAPALFLFLGHALACFLRTGCWARVLDAGVSLGVPVSAGLPPPEGVTGVCRERLAAAYTKLARFPMSAFGRGHAAATYGVSRILFRAVHCGMTPEAERVLSRWTATLVDRSVGPDPPAELPRLASSVPATVEAALALDHGPHGGPRATDAQVFAGLRGLEAAVPTLWRMPLLNARKEPIWRLWPPARSVAVERAGELATMDLWDALASFAEGGGMPRGLTDRALHEAIMESALLECIRRVYLLKQTGNAATDPFRVIVLDLLKEKETFKRAEVQEAAQLRNINVTETMYNRVIKDMCQSRGYQWLLKAGADMEGGPCQL
ncbi:hypothetical protein FOA52_013600 [Chlamydomonas sp. UWO 241]|nr:hypothetical protein FOA52_013600 [Chlamydomonas sp. UWO 241]